MTPTPLMPLARPRTPTPNAVCPLTPNPLANEAVCPLMPAKRRSINVSSYRAVGYQATTNAPTEPEKDLATKNLGAVTSRHTRRADVTLPRPEYGAGPDQFPFSLASQCVACPGDAQPPPL